MHRPLYIYLQRPSDAEWVTVGEYKATGDGQGLFKYLASYIESGNPWSIDPVNLPIQSSTEFQTTRYGGLHDVLRDASPDSWGQSVIREQFQLSSNASSLQYFLKAGDPDRWGALAVGTSLQRREVKQSSLMLSSLNQIIEELTSFSDRRPAVRESIRSRLVRSVGLGGARPKTTVGDEAGDSWILKPAIATDEADIPVLEHFGQQWGSASGLNFAKTFLDAGAAGESVLRVLRFDRSGRRRHMCLSAASLLQTEYPGKLQTDYWSYPLLAERLASMNVPAKDSVELFGRMVFNAVCGNDDDHVRNHAVVYSAEEAGWRLAPAYDVVPNPVETPNRLQMQLSKGRFDISRDALLADYHSFSFAHRTDVEQYLDALLVRIQGSFENCSQLLDTKWRTTLRERMEHNISVIAR